jgi:hypothetical protein
VRQVPFCCRKAPWRQTRQPDAEVQAAQSWGQAGATVVPLWKWPVRGTQRDGRVAMVLWSLLALQEVHFPSAVQYSQSTGQDRQASVELSE